MPIDMLIGKQEFIAGKPEDVWRVKCCGKITLLYKRDRKQFCTRCDHEYDFNGKDKGIFGTGCNDHKAAMKKKYNLRG